MVAELPIQVTDTASDITGVGNKAPTQETDVTVDVLRAGGGGALPDELVTSTTGAEAICDSPTSEIDSGTGTRIGRSVTYADRNSSSVQRKQCICLQFESRRSDSSYVPSATPVHVVSSAEST